MKKTFTFILALLATISTEAQNFSPPANFALDNAGDYAAYEEDVKKCFEMIMNTHADDKSESLKNANIFLLKWMTGSPNVSIVLNEAMITYMKSTPELLIIYMGGWTNNSLTTGVYDNEVADGTAGLEAVMKYYTDNKAILGKDKNVEKFIKMKTKGTLEAYINENS